ncbi:MULTISPECIES: hypothetical protein [Leuconostoc]|uniref:hypothetical protein n=1 Tax=Leuconostoc TaxID=1243 RepID=UPI0032DF1948
MNKKNKLSIVLIILLLSLSFIAVQLFMSNQKNRSKISNSTVSHSKIYIKKQLLNSYLGKLEPTELKEIENLNLNNCYISEGEWVNKDQIISKDNIKAPITGLFSMSGGQGKIYSPSAQIVFNVPENEVNYINTESKINYSINNYNIYKGQTQIKSIDVGSSEEIGSISQYKVISNPIQQDQLDLQKIKFGQHVIVEIESDNLIIAKKSLNKDNSINVKIKNDWIKMPVEVVNILENEVVIKPKDGLREGIEIK